MPPPGAPPERSPHFSSNKVVDGEEVIVEQGHALDRPSRIEVHAPGDKAEIAGKCVVTAHGFLTGLSV
jgi:predicted PhzF superfamily epimerase YddE/YHI9